jgi:MFS family permease
VWHAAPIVDVTRGSLWRDGDFVKLWTGQTVSELGTVVTRTALPIVAVVTLHATAIEMGILIASSSIAVLLVGLFAGVLVDRSRRRPLLIGTDAVRAVLLLAIPILALSGSLRIEQLYVVAFVEAGLGALFDIAYRTYLPSLLPAERLLEGNTKIGTTSAIAELGGPGIAGALVQLITAPLALLVDACSYVISAISLLLIRRPERQIDPPGHAGGVWQDLRAGLFAVAGHPLLRPLALASGTSQLFGSFFASLYTLYALDELGLSPLLLGLVVSAGGVGSLAATALVGPLTRRFGIGPTILWTRVGAGILAFLVPIAGGPPLVAALFLFIPQLIGDGLQTVSMVDAITVRQLVTPQRLLGRVNGTMTVLLEGIAPVGAVVGALIAEAFGLRLAFGVAVAGSLLGTGFLLFSPLRTLRTVAERPLGGLEVSNP